MKNNKNIQLLLIGIFIVCSILSYVLLNIVKDKKIESLSKQRVDEYTTKYNAILNKYKHEADILFDVFINDPLVIFFLTNKDIQSVADLFLADYKRFKEYEIKQFRLLLENDSKALIFNNKEHTKTFSKDIGQNIFFVDKRKTILDGFEKIDNEYLYQCIYPINIEGKYIGAFDISFTINMILKDFYKLNMINIELLKLDNLKQEYGFTDKQIGQKVSTHYVENYKKLVTVFPLKNGTSSVLVVKEKDFLIDEVLLTHKIILLTTIFLILLACIIIYFETKSKKQLKYTNEKLEIALSKFEHIFNYTTVGFLITDEKRNIIDANPRFLKMFAYNETEKIIGKNTRIFHIDQAHFDEYGDLVYSKSSQEKLLDGIVSMEYEFLKNNGDTIWCEILGSPLSDDAKLPHGGTLWTIIDINEKVIAQKTIKEQNNKLHELNKNLNDEVKRQIDKIREKDMILIQQSKLASMGEMMDAVAHQWKQPLNIVKMSAQEIGYMVKDDDIDKEYFLKIGKRVSKQVNHMVQTLDEFRSFLRPKVEYEDICIKEIIDSSLVLMKDELVKYTIMIKFIGDDKLEAKVIPNEFKHVIINIVNNAKDEFVLKDIKTRIITFEVSKDDLFTILKIKDTAGGISKDIIGDIFKANVTTKDDDKGTGIGLYMSKNIIEKTGGSIEVENIDAGAQFTIRIPV